MQSGQIIVESNNREGNILSQIMRMLNNRRSDNRKRTVLTLEK